MLIKRTTGVALAAGAAALSLAVIPGAHALSHTTLTVGGSTSPSSASITGSLSTDNIAFTTNYGVKMFCNTLVAEGDVYPGTTVAVGNKIGDITDLQLLDCRATDLNIPVTVTMTAGAITVAAHPANAGDPVPVDIEVVNATITATNPSIPCNFTANGSLAATAIPGTNGTAAPDGFLEMTPAAFSGANPVSGFTLDLTVPTGTTCAGEVVDGDEAGSWWVDDKGSSPSQTIKPKIQLSTGGLGDISHS